MLSTQTRIGIVGGGTTGLYLTILLKSRGFDVSLFERAPKPRVDGCGILMIASGLQALSLYDTELSNEIIQAGIKVSRYEFCNLKGDIAFSNSAAETEAATGFPAVVVHREDIAKALLRRINLENLYFDHSLESVESNNDKVTAKFRNGQSWEGDLLIGTDGLNSKVRSFVEPEIQPSYLGDIVWRGIMPNNHTFSEGDFVVYMRAHGVYANAFNIGQNRCHWGFFIEREQAEDEKGLPAPQNTQIPPEEFAKLPDVMRQTIEMTPQENIVCRYSYDINPMQRIVADRVIILGDAAHAKSPSRAQGMSSGLEDAVVFANYLTSSATVDEALATFEKERLPIIHELQLTSREMSQKTGRTKKLQTVK
ncbi:monooxygenase FAD-binding protein [Calothrix sp. NIES-4071]|nr:monooxygenase FAD-binding protein [Calothrix sp. NIES-4071]BAZ56312.1 monooxygenase FAD-binding protein [Calothrix sp. NIES-4105]